MRFEPRGTTQSTRGEREKGVSLPHPQIELAPGILQVPKGNLHHKPKHPRDRYPTGKHRRAARKTAAFCEMADSNSTLCDSGANRHSSDRGSEPKLRSQSDVSIDRSLSQHRQLLALAPPLKALEEASAVLSDGCPPRSESGQHDRPFPGSIHCTSAAGHTGQQPKVRARSLSLDI